MAVSRQRSIIGAVVLALLWILIIGASRFLNVCTQSVHGAREQALQDDLYTLRSLVRDYSTEQNHRPESLQDLVAAGYIKTLPMDPMTNRRDSWVIERSKGPENPGVVSVRSGSSSVSSKGTKYSDW
jgi:general secretion pathway protein G